MGCICNYTRSSNSHCSCTEHLWCSKSFLSPCFSERSVSVYCSYYSFTNSRNGASRSKITSNKNLIGWYVHARYGISSYYTCHCDVYCITSSESSIPEVCYCSRKRIPSDLILSTEWITPCDRSPSSDENAFACWSTSVLFFELCSRNTRGNTSDTSLPRINVWCSIHPHIPISALASVEPPTTAEVYIISESCFHIIPLVLVVNLESIEDSTHSTLAVGVGCPSFRPTNPPSYSTSSEKCLSFSCFQCTIFSDEYVLRSSSEPSTLRNRRQ